MTEQLTLQKALITIKKLKQHLQENKKLKMVIKLLLF